MNVALHPEETERTSCGVRRDPVDRSALRVRAEYVAARHMRACTREFVEFLSGRLDDEEIAQLFVGAYPEAKRAEIVREFLDYCIAARIA